MLGRVYTAQKDYDKAIGAFERATATNLSIDLTASARAFMGHTYAVSGQKRKALSIAHEFDRDRLRGDAAAAVVAMIYAALGDTVSALKWLERAYVAQNSLVRSVKVESVWDPLRSDAHFQEFVRRLKLPE
jgi:tetratricopeptide (TPR) repeat protein